MRELEPNFIKDLKDGILKDIISRVKEDDTLDFQIRENEVHIYYRGGRILGLKADNNKYIPSFDTSYCAGKICTNQLDSLPEIISSEEELLQWVTSFPFLKQTIDFHFATENQID